MIVDMKFEESSLTRYLVKNLEPLTKADPVILSEYVVALLKKDKPIEELQQLCSEKLLEFLGHGTKSFITKLFHSLEDGSIVETAKGLDAVDQVGPSPSLTTEDPVELKNLSSKPEGVSPPSGHGSDSEEKEASDDDDDDRNHKHRRRETPSQSFDKEVHEQLLRRPNRKRNKPFENGRMFPESDPQPSENWKTYNPASLERDLFVKFEKRHPVLGPLPRAHLDIGQRTRSSQAFRGDPGFHFDLSASLGCLPIERGRGRGSGSWSQHDSRFSSVDALDFASQMTLQGHLPPSLFTGRGLQDATSTHSASWSAFGLIPGMPNPLLQGTLRPPINPTLSIGIPRQRCKDFEERGFCLRGDMCPMEHGVNRIVVEDVQSLSQFNLPVSLPSAHLLGAPAGTGPLSSVNAPSSLLTNCKDAHGKSSKPGTSDDGLGLNRVFASAGEGDPDLYDPDQPLWNTDRPETSSALLRLPSPRIDETEPLWDADSSDRPNFRLSDDREYPVRSIAPVVGSHGATSSVWGRIGNSGNKIEMAGKTDSTITSMSVQNEAKENQEQALSSVPGNGNQRKWTVSENVGSKVMKSVAVPRLQSNLAGNVGRTSQKALRTLFVNGIPLKNNKREALLSHFQNFGEVIDIYIPLNSERAFVQFSRREEAEAALKAPDAVMGNRFIKLWWANRDSVPVNSLSTGNIASAAPSGMTSVSDRGKENLPSVAPKVSCMPASEVTVSAAVHPRPVMTNGPKVPPSSQKKLENLELLKEELRLKQEMLDQKRIDFRRQLQRLEKQAITVKGEGTTEQAIKRHKVAMVTDGAKSATSRPTNPCTTGARLAEKALDKNNPGESIVSPTSKANSTMVLQSTRSSKQPIRLSAPVGTPLLVNRFKLDNRPSTFIILPPVPADFANVTVLKEHFSSFGDLSTVELEAMEAHTGAVCSKPSENCSARITFTTRRSAERAFSNGKCWQGHNLQFSWLTTSSNSSNNCGGRENSPTATPKGAPDAEVVADNVTSGSSSSIPGKSTCSASHVEATIGNGLPLNSEGIKIGAEPMELVEACQSNPVTISSCETGSPEADIVIHEDGLNVEIAQ